MSVKLRSKCYIRLMGALLSRHCFATLTVQVVTAALALNNSMIMALNGCLKCKKPSFLDKKC